jgi:16S rRNA (guanine966-N2)-methyltransferase
LNGINLKNSINTFDIIFLDPPYKEKNLKKILDNISSEKLMKDNGVIIIHRHKNEKDQLSENLKIIEEKKYGISKIIFGILN